MNMCRMQVIANTQEHAQWEVGFDMADIPPSLLTDDGVQSGDVWEAIGRRDAIHPGLERSFDVEPQ